MFWRIENGLRLLGYLCGQACIWLRGVCWLAAWRGGAFVGAPHGIGRDRISRQQGGVNQDE